MPVSPKSKRTQSRKSSLKRSVKAPARRKYSVKAPKKSRSKLTKTALTGSVVALLLYLLSKQKKETKAKQPVERRLPNPAPAVDQPVKAHRKGKSNFAQMHNIAAPYERIRPISETLHFINTEQPESF